VALETKLLDFMRRGVFWSTVVVYAPMQRSSCVPDV